MGFGTFIREKREQANVPMNEFARSLGISPAYWSRIERELEKAPKDELIVKAAEKLGLNCAGEKIGQAAFCFFLRLVGKGLQPVRRAG
ncbi:MAG: helix-turn-helix transcriptional regulator [Sphingobacteriales bacterium]|nr:helix-turn-helix transcriptional regulator [Sphingobacteriales bacterium]